MAEQERGMDVEFINPTPYCVLKSRNWPSLIHEASETVTSPPVSSETIEGQKVFINICSSDKLEKPQVVCGDNGDATSWSIPHSFSPPVEDLDKENKLCLVSRSHNHENFSGSNNRQSAPTAVSKWPDISRGCVYDCASGAHIPAPYSSSNFKLCILALLTTANKVAIFLIS